MQEQIPMLSLRMSSYGAELPELYDDSESSTDKLVIMKSQEKSYQCRNYFARRSKNKAAEIKSPYCGTQTDLQQDDTPDMLCREKMCEWSYKVCDHFQTNREIVAYAFSFLDRFVDRCNCDRTAFKLASMTSLYMSTKIFNSKQISIKSLADLSRGEFDVNHIAEMERIILETLNWRMNPPTVQAFIDHMIPLVNPLTDERTALRVYRRATFFAELSVYDYTLVTEDRYEVATGCILNAMESVKAGAILGAQFLKLLPFNPSTLVFCEDRLWHLYGCSAQLLEDEVRPARRQFYLEYKGDAAPNVSTHSPVGVTHY